MLQWREDKREEKRKELGGGETTSTTYTYTKVWSETPIDATRFKKPEGHANPPFAVASQEQRARTVTVGAFRLSASLLAALGGYEKVAVVVPAALLDKAKGIDGDIYLGQDPASPQLGDTRVSFSQVPPQTVSLYAAQRGTSFAPYVTTIGKPIERIETGEHSAQAMFQDAVAENTVMTWVLRGVGFVLLFIGFALAFQPISVVLDVLPFLGDVASWGLGFFAFLLALVCSLITIAVAWIVFRPLLGGALLVAAVALFFGLGRRKKAAA
ncbi:TMEM43 family protein [Solidesulfovibrio aerotolerans]|uniref:TMEM43 family protein n=1 Tax=Solidesulfovibrio aerotolerans TaxID=295255 RepID=UPI001FE59FAA|nr:TMEM43 family protein [Solidesulfovibrio aerotolerans]